VSNECTYCGCDVTAHDPVYVSEGAERTPAGRFCTYGCLSAYVEREGLVEGTYCRVER
jgi:hypothetical protein